MNEQQLIEKAKQGDMEAKEKLIKKYDYLIYKYAWFYRGHGLEIDDLYQEGVIGLLKAIKKFDFSKNVKFITYATWWIRQSIQRAISYNNLIRLPVHRMVEHYKKKKNNEFSEYSRYFVSSLDDVMVEGKRFKDSLHYMDVVADEKDIEENVIDKLYFEKVLQQAFRKMSETERKVLIMHELQGEPYHKIGEKLGKTAQRIQVINSKALKKVREVARSVSRG